MESSLSERPEIDSDAMRRGMGCFPTGVTIVTALEEGEPVGFTCQSFVSLSLEPPLIAISPAKSSTSWPRMVAAGTFCVNVLSADQRDVCMAFARSGGNKFQDVAWQIGAHGSPIIDDVVAAFECELITIHDAGDHEIVVGRVLSIASNDRAPLLYLRSELVTTAFA
jgi:3-hydroxy-9,10-secoandrosta-1,3,5(10)-triene-9,17-dione monooxygenase reductase component